MYETKALTKKTINIASNSQQQQQQFKATTANHQSFDIIFFVLLLFSPYFCISCSQVWCFYIYFYIYIYKNNSLIRS